ncbi:hypothetical protein ACLB2K_001885 [Fragaria x ananassa]
MELKVAQVFISSLRISVFDPPDLSHLTFSSVIEDQVLAIMVKMSPDASDSQNEEEDDETQPIWPLHIYTVYIELTIYQRHVQGEVYQQKQENQIPCHGKEEGDWSCCKRVEVHR